MRKVLGWIDRELTRLDCIIEGAPPEALEPNTPPEALKKALGDCPADPTTTQSLFFAD